MSKIYSRLSLIVTQNIHTSFINKHFNLFYLS